MKINTRTYIGTVIFFIVIISGLLLYVFTFIDQPKSLPADRVTQCKYKNINPLRCEPDLAKKKREYVILRNDLVELIEQKKKSDEVESVSVYFRDLQNGPILSINGQENFAPASLLKLPIMISYFKKAEVIRDLLKHKIRVPENISSLPQNIQPGITLEKGKVYAVGDLISILIIQSDNLSSSLLLSYLGEDDFVSTLSDLGIIDPKMDSAKQFVTVQNYASIFRILYNSSYLNIEMSDKALDLLSKSVFREGILAGVPEGTKVAHKFGERDYEGDKQLHDCGIIYYPDNPYLLCIMTKGDSFAELTAIISEISKKVYTELNSRNSHKNE